MKRLSLFIPFLLSSVLVSCGNNSNKSSQEKLIEEYKKCDYATYKRDFNLEQEKRHDRELSEEEKTTIINTFSESGVNGLKQYIYASHILVEDEDILIRNTVEYGNIYTNAVEGFYINNWWAKDTETPKPGTIDKHAPTLAFFLKEDGETLVTGYDLMEGLYYSPIQDSFKGEYLDYLLNYTEYTPLLLFMNRNQYYYRKQMEVSKAYKDGEGYILFYEQEINYETGDGYWIQCFHFNKAMKLTKFFQYSNPFGEHSRERCGSCTQVFYSYESNGITPTYDLNK